MKREFENICENNENCVYKKIKINSIQKRKNLFDNNNNINKKIKIENDDIKIYNYDISEYKYYNNNNYSYIK